MWKNEASVKCGGVRIPFRLDVNIFFILYYLNLKKFICYETYSTCSSSCPEILYYLPRLDKCAVSSYFALFASLQPVFEQQLNGSRFDATDWTSL